MASMCGLPLATANVMLGSIEQDGSRSLRHQLLTEVLSAKTTAPIRLDYHARIHVEEKNCAGL
jgi:hypothetical protein